MLPYRILTAEQAKQIRHFYYWTNLSSEFFRWLLWPGLSYWGVSLVMGALFSDQVRDQYVTLNGHQVWLGLFILWRLWRQLAAHAAEAYQSGREVPICFVSLDDNYGFKINGVSRHTITVRKDNELLTIKTLDSTVVAAYSPASQLAYVLDKCPDILLPTSIFTDESQPRLRT